MKHFRKTLCVLLAALLLCGVCVPAFAEEESAAPGTSLVIPAQPAATRGVRLTDAARVLSDREANDLLAQLDETSRRLQFDIVIVTASILGSRTMQELAADYYDYNGFGYGPRKDGSLLLVQPQSQSWYVCTRGFGINALDSSYFISLLKNDSFQTALTAGNYKNAFDRYVFLTEAFLTEANGGRPYSDAHPYSGAGGDKTYGAPVWKWEDGGLATAVFRSADGSETVTVTASPAAGTVSAAAGENGATVYTAVVTFDGKLYTDTHTQKAAPAPLTYRDPIWQWESESLARATFVSTDGSSKISVSAEAKDGAITSAPGENGATVYTATVSFDGKTYTDTHTVAAPALTYRDPIWQWENERLARAIFVSTDGSDKTSVSTQDGDIKSETRPNGDVVYTATVTFKDKQYSDTYTVPAPTYGKPTWTWNGTESATATFVSADGSVTRSLTATAAKGSITAKTSGNCGNGGKTVTTATVTFGGKTYTNKVTQPLAHKWKTALTRATLKADGAKTFTCTVCGKKTVNKIAKIAKVSLSKTKYAENGKVQSPKVTVKDANGKTLKKNKAYTVAYADGRKEIGAYTVTVTFKGNYSGKKTLKFKILPAAPQNVTATPGDGKAILAWTAVPGAEQYKIYCMREGGKSFFHCGTSRTPASEIGSLKNGTTYLFKVKAIKNVNGTALAGAACKAVRVTPTAAAPAAPQSAAGSR